MQAQRRPQTCIGRYEILKLETKGNSAIRDASIAESELAEESNRITIPETNPGYMKGG